MTTTGPTSNFSNAADMNRQANRYQQSTVLRNLANGNTYNSISAFTTAMGKPAKGSLDEQLVKYFTHTSTVTGNNGTSYKINMFQQLSMLDGRPGLSQGDIDVMARADNNANVDDTREVGRLRTLSSNDFKITTANIRQRVAGAIQNIAGWTERQVELSDRPEGATGPDNRVISPTINGNRAQNRAAIQREVQEIQNGWSSPSANSPLNKSISIKGIGNELSVENTSPKQLYDQFTAEGGRIVFTDRADLETRFAEHPQRDMIVSSGGFIGTDPAADDPTAPVIFINLDDSDHVIGDDNHAGINGTIAHELLHYDQLFASKNGNLVMNNEVNLTELANKERAAKMYGAAVIQAHGGAEVIEPEVLKAGIEKDILNVYNAPLNIDARGNGPANTLFGAVMVPVVGADGRPTGEVTPRRVDNRDVNNYVSSRGVDVAANQANIGNIETRLQGNALSTKNVRNSGQIDRASINAKTAKYIAALQNGSTNGTGTQTFTQGDFDRLAGTDSYGQTLSRSDVTLNPNAITNTQDLQDYVGDMQSRNIDRSFTGVRSDQTPGETYREMVAINIGLDQIAKNPGRYESQFQTPGGFTYEQILDAAADAQGTSRGSHSDLENSILRTPNTQLSESQIARYFTVAAAADGDGGQRLKSGVFGLQSK